jgi:hypothetical protein
VEENGPKIDGDEVYNECTVFLSVAEELMKKDTSTDKKLIQFSAKSVLQIF